jgi:hypothetical protein
MKRDLRNAHATSSSIFGTANASQSPTPAATAKKQKFFASFFQKRRFFFSEEKKQKTFIPKR